MLQFYTPHEYNEKLHDFIANPAAGSGGGLIGASVLRKTVDPTTWVIGANNLLVPSGAVRIDLLSLRVVTTFTSAGVPTLDIGFPGATTRYNGVSSYLLAALVAGNLLSRNNAGSVAASNFDYDIGLVNTAPPIRHSLANVLATLGTAVYTGGSLEVVAIYTPLTAGATLT